MKNRIFEKGLFLIIGFLVIVFVVFLFFWVQNKNKLSNSQIKKQEEYILSLMKTKLPQKALPSKTLPLIQYVLPNATCYYFAGAALAHYLENTNFDEFIWYGRPLRFKYDERFGSLRTGPPAGDLVMEAFYNLGYTAYQGNTRGQPMPAILMTHMTANDNFIYFKTQDEAFDFIKRLISADVPVMLNGAPMKGKTKGDFGFFAGYDEQNVYIRPEPTKGPFFYQEPEVLTEFMKMPTKEFLAIWARSDNEFYWFEKTHERKSAEEIFTLNKNDTKETYQNMQKFIANLPKDFGLRSYSSDGDGINSRASAYRYLQKLGYNDLAQKYLEIAKIYNTMQSEKADTAENFKKIANLENQAASLWK